MSDTKLNQFLASGTTAERLAFVPSPPTPASGPDPSYLWWDTSLQAEFAWNAGSSAWVAITGGGGSSAFNAITGGTNTSAAMVVGTGASMATSGSGTIAATSVPVAGISGLGTGVATFLATPSSANLATAVTDETGSGALVFATSPTLVTPALGTPTSGVLTNATGLPIATGVSGLGTSVATALGVNVGSAGAVVVNGGALGTPSSGTLTNATGLPIATGVSGLGAGVATFLATPSSANLSTAVTDETGSGSLVFATAPTLPSTVTIGAAAGTTGAALFNGTTSGTVTLSVADAAGTYTLKLPTTIGTSGQFLQTDGVNQATWATASGGGGITIGTTTITSGTSGRVLYDNAGVVGEMTNTGTGTVNVLQTAPTLTGPVTISEVAGSSALTITGATQTSNFPVLSVTQTWNSAGTTFTGSLLNITSTASAAASLLQDWQVAGVAKASLRKDGALLFSGNLYSVGGGGFGSGANINLGVRHNNTIDFLIGASSTRGSFAAAASGVFSGGWVVGSSYGYGWTNSSIDATATVDLGLLRAAAATLQLGADVNGAATSQQIQAANGITGTDKTGGNLTLASGKGTGAGAVSSLIFQTPTVLTTGTTAQSLATRLTLTSTTMTSTVQGIMPASTTSLSSLRLPHGSAPTSPVDGDMWTTTAGLFVRINGATVGPLT